MIMAFFKKMNARWLLLPLLLLSIFLLDIAMGPVKIPLADIISGVFFSNTSDPIWLDILWDFRITKAVTCVLAGSALSISGLQMQTLFRNPLAGPDVLGLSSGASLAVSLLLLGNQFLYQYLSGPWTLVLAATLGCISVFLLMLLFANRLQDSASLLIIGLMVGAGTSSIVSVLQYSSKAEALQTFLIWTFGNVGSLNWSEIHVLFWVVLAGTVLVLFSSKNLNSWLLGDNYARGLGVNLKKTRLTIIVSTSILTGAVTAFCGPIAFVGLAVPHLTKLWIDTSNHKVLVPNALMVGSILLLLCDILSQLPGDSKVLPLNAVTALFGAPVVIWVVLRSKMIRV